MQITGKFIGNERGFGFVIREVGEDIFIPPHQTNGALNGDDVICVLRTHELKRKFQDTPGRERVSGKIIEVTRRAPMLGTFFFEGAQGFVRPTDKKNSYVFSVPMKTIAKFSLADGHRVVFSINKRARPDEQPEPCFVTEILGHVNDPGVDVLTLIYEAGVSFEFPEEVKNEKIPSEIAPEDLHGRRDLRAENIFTIDGDDTKDIDDAISFEKTADGFRLGVHIADVAHYVRAGTAIDAAAFLRGTSIYLADRVIPMLPHALSSGICSLFPGVDRLTLSCLMTVDTDGNVTDYEITPSIIHSKRRFTYNEVQEILDGGDDPVLNSMDELRGILREKREKRGALDFDLPEAKIRADENGRVIAIEPVLRNNATGIIEEFMILCNETIAAHYFAQKTPFVYRTHEEPSKEKLAALAAQLPAASQVRNKRRERTSEAENNPPRIKIPKRINASALQSILDAVKDTPAAYTVSSAILRALPQAAYTCTNPTHFGLASEAYCHFTSPIRRYADLQVHRIIKDSAGASPPRPSRAYVLAGRPAASPGVMPHELFEKSSTKTQETAQSAVSDERGVQGNVSESSPEVLENLSKICAQCSRTERIAEQLERDVTELKKVQFMADKEGRVFDAIVSGITSWGIFVMLENTAEGLIPAPHLAKHQYKFNKESNVYEAKRRKGEKTGKVLRSGSAIKVRLIRANEDERRLIFKIDF
ncbi:MAG: VacB/RNase II family 3'-5' exoribonuclease [Defluviitaleaceae bacterium]|nr:VacB/RNase II family 3'-5' exoribonuclease [Defluviitaleaceae bacterium]